MKEHRTTWRIELARVQAGDTLIANTLTEEEMDKLFDPGFGGSEGPPFTAWSEEYVYFPAVYDGEEWVERVPRNPCDTKTHHVGGE
jgi:hypothetical protein